MGKGGGLSLMVYECISIPVLPSSCARNATGTCKWWK